MSDSGPDQLPRLTEGTILSGRYRVVAPMGDATGVYEARDASIGERRVALVVSAPSDGLGEAWAALASPAAVLVDLLSVADALIGVFALPEEAEPLQRASQPSRTQRASMLADVHSLLELEREAPVRLIHAEGLLWSSSSLGARATAIPMPARGLDASACLAADARAFADLLAQQLYGVAGDEGRDRLPEAVGALLERWDGEESEALPTSAELRAALGLNAATARVPVPTAPLAQAQAAKTRIAAARGRARKVARRETAALLLLLSGLALGLSGLLRTPNDGAQSEITEAFVEEQASTLRPTPQAPEPIASTRPAELWDEAAPHAAVYAAMIEDGPTPRFVTREGESALSNLSVVTFDPDKDGRVDRIERRTQTPGGTPPNRLLGYTTLEYDDAGRAIQRTEYASTGRRLRSTTFAYDRSVYATREASGQWSDLPCAEVAFELDALGRYRSRACLDSAGERATFADGYAEVQSAWSADGQTLEERYLDVSGAPALSRDGVHLEVTRFTADGQVAERSFFGLDGEPVLEAESGAARIAYTSTREPAGALAASFGLSVDALLHVDRTALFGVDGRPTMGHDGWHSETQLSSSQGAPLQETTRDTEGRLVPRVGTSVAELRYVSDTLGHITELSRYDDAGEPTTNASGEHAVTYVRDAHGLVLEECRFGLDGPMAAAALFGAHCVSYRHDARGLVTRVSYFGVDRRAVVSERTGAHQALYTHDDVGRLTAKRYRDAFGKPTPTHQGAYGVLIEHDRFGNVTSFRYVDASDAPLVTSGGISEVRLARDVIGREVHRCFFAPSRGGATSRPAALRGDTLGGGATCVARVFEGEALVELRYQNASGDLVNANIPSAEPRSAALVRFRYRANGVLYQQDLFEADGESKVATIDCATPYTCIDASGWGWHAP